MKWIRNNLTSILLSVALIGLLSYHFFETYNPPITQSVIITPTTNSKQLKNGEYVDVKVNTPPTLNPNQSGFSKEYVNDTIGKILGISREQISNINKITGKYKDSLQLYKTEVDEKNRLVKYYQSKNNKGDITGNAKIIDDSGLVYEGNVSLTTVVKKGKIDIKKKIYEPDTLIFYDPNQKIKINQSYEYEYQLQPTIVTKKQKLTFSVQAGAGLIIPQFKPEKTTFGGYIGVGISHNF